LVCWIYVVFVLEESRVLSSSLIAGTLLLNITKE
jgi:hypothetical protein